MYDGFIYETTCLATNMKYRGRKKRTHYDDINDPDDKWYIGSPTDSKFWDDVEKYGRDQFVRKIILDGPFEDESAIIKAESKLLKEVDAANNPLYYNKSNWGGTKSQSGENNPMYGKFGPLHHRYGITHTDEVKKNLSLHHADVSGCNNPMYGKTFSQEHRDKIREGRKPYWSGDNNPRHIDPPVGKKNPMYGRKRITKDGENISVYIDELPMYLQQGWKLGLTIKRRSS